MEESRLGIGQIEWGMRIGFSTRNLDYLDDPVSVIREKHHSLLWIERDITNRDKNSS